MARDAVAPAAIAGTVSIAATNVTGSVALAPGGGNHIIVTNDGPATVFVRFGDSNVTATVPNGATAGAYPVAAGSAQTFTLSEVTRQTHAAAITSASTATVYFTAADGA